MAFRPLNARPPAVLLREAKPLKAIFRHAERLSHLQRLLESQLQPAAREHCHVASWREGTLLLIVTDGHWATRLRYQQKRLHRQLVAFDEFINLTRIAFKVQPPDARAEQPRTPSTCRRSPPKTFRPPPRASPTPSCVPPLNGWPAMPGTRSNPETICQPPSPAHT